MHTQHESTEHRLSRNKILIINSNDNTQSGHSENGLTFKCDYLESLCLRCKDVCDGMKRYECAYYFHNPMTVANECCVPHVLYVLKHLTLFNC